VLLKPAPLRPALVPGDRGPDHQCLLHYRTYAVEGYGEAALPRKPPFPARGGPVARRTADRDPARGGERATATNGSWRACGSPPLSAGRRLHTSCLWCIWYRILRAGGARCTGFAQHWLRRCAGLRPASV